MCLALLLLPMSALAATKDEIVYVNLSETGAVTHVAIVNRFESTSADLITDYGQYLEVINLTDLQPLTVSEDVITAQMEPGTFYYQGQSASTAIPWHFDIEYALNGAKTAPEKLTGASGEVRIALRIRQNLDFDPVYFDNYALQMTLTFDSGACRNITAEGGTQLNAGTDKLINYTVLPESEKDYVITLDAVNFEMDAISINGIPLNMDVDSIDTTEMKDKVHELQNGISKIDSGARAIKSATEAMDDGATTLYEASAGVASGVSSLNGGAQQLTTHSAAIAASMQKIAEQFEQVMGAAGPMQQGGQALASGSRELSAGLSALNEQFSTLITASSDIGRAIGALGEAAAGASPDIANMKRLLSIVSDYPEITDSYGKYISSARRLIGTAEGLQSGLNDLSTNYASFEAALSGCAEAIAKLDAASASLSQGIADYTDPLNELIGSIDGSSATQGAEQYAQLDAALRSLSDSLATLDAGYATLHEGIGELEQGMAALAGGATDLKQGTGELSHKTGDMDAQIDDEVDEALAKFSNDNFTPRSFADERNEVRLVQFVLKTDALELPDEEEEVIEEEVKQEGFVARLLALFE